MPRVGLVVQDSFPKDRLVRIRKIARTLARSGFETVVMCRNRDGRPERERLEERLTVTRFGGRLPESVRTLLWHPLPVSPVWLYAVWRAARRERLDLLVVTNLRLALPTVIAGRLSGVPVAFDMAEYFPTMPWVQKARLGPVERVVKRPGVIRLLERAVVRLVDHTVVVVEEQKRRLAEAGVPEERLTVVSNTPVLDEHAGGEEDEAGKEGLEATRRRARDSGGLHLVYTGIVTRGRGLTAVLEAVDEFGRRWPEEAGGLSLTVVGDGSYLGELRAQAATLGVDDRVRFTGWVSPEEIPGYLEEADAGLIPHVVSDFWNHTVPNKLFDYMNRGLTVVATPCRPVERIVEREGCGVVVPEDPAAMARAFRELMDSPDRLRRMGERGRRGVERTYNWHRDGSRLLRAIRETAGR